jgi:membrane-bound serine protease (ClpP class)
MRGEVLGRKLYNTSMHSRKITILVFLYAILVALPWKTAQAQETTPQAFVITASGPLTPAMAEYLSRGIATAQRENAELLVFQLDTPGGEVVLMGEMVEIILASQVPVVVYIAPNGASAGSAGTVLTLAGKVAAMAPETTIGAASPIGGSGEDLGETLETKIKEEIKAKIRSLTERRPQEAIDMALDTVENAIALTAREAFEVGLIDIIAVDIPDLLRQLDGWTVETTGGTRTLNTQYVQANYIETRFIEELLTILTNPNIVFLLLSIGFQAILIELGSPGGWVAGFVGVASLALAAYGMGVLPVNWFGLVFMATAFVLFFLELKAPTHGALAVAGIASFIVGALVLFNSAATPSFFRVSVPLIVITGVFTAATFLVALTFAIRSQQVPVRTGQVALVGRSGRVRVPIQKHSQGKVHLAGEMWTAELAEGEEPLEEGDRVEVVEVDGIRLRVKKKD